MSAHKRRSKIKVNKPRGQGIDYRCLCGQPSTVLMWLVQLNADDLPQQNYVPLCADCLELERQYNGEPARLTPAPQLQIAGSRDTVRDALRARLTQHGPASSADLATELKLTYTSVWNAMSRMARRGEITVVNEVRQHNGRLTKIWSISR